MAQTAKKGARRSGLPQALASANDKAVRSENPMDWIYDNPNGPLQDFGFGVLRKVYQGFQNSAQEFGGRKLRPVPGVDAQGRATDEVTAYRTGTVLPADAPDCLDEPEVLFRAFDTFTCAHEPSLLIYVTLSFPDASRLHHAWEEARAFSYEKFAMERQLPVALIQHKPGDAGSDNPPHVHLLVGPRRLDGTGFRGYARELLCDDAQALLFKEWMAFK